MRPNARIRVTFSYQSTASPIIDCGTNSKGCLKEFFAAFGLSWSELLSITIFGHKIMIDRLWVCETHALIRVFLLARTPEGKKNTWKAISWVCQWILTYESPYKIMNLTWNGPICMPYGSSMKWNQVFYL